MDQLNSNGTAAAAKTPVNSKINDLIDETSKLSAGSLLPSLNNTQNFLSDKRIALNVGYVFLWLSKYLLMK